MVYQAVAEYWTHAKKTEYNLDVNLGIPGRVGPARIKFNRNNHYTTRTEKVAESRNHTKAQCCNNFFMLFFNHTVSRHQPECPSDS